MEEDKPGYKAVREAGRRATDEFAKAMTEQVKKLHINSSQLKELQGTQNVHTGILSTEDNVHIPVFYIVNVEFGKPISQEKYQALYDRQVARGGKTEVIVNGKRVE